MAGMREQRQEQRLKDDLFVWVALVIFGVMAFYLGAMSNRAVPSRVLTESTPTRSAAYGVAALTMTARHEDLVAKQTPAVEAERVAENRGTEQRVALVDEKPPEMVTTTTFATPTPKATMWVVVLANVLNARAGPSTNDGQIGQVRLDQCLEVVLVGGGWYKVALADGQQGWSSGEYLKEVAACPPGSEVVASNAVAAPIAVVAPATVAATPTVIVAPGAQTNQGANLRAGPSTDYPIVGGAQAGNSVQVVARTADGAWLKLGSGAWIAAFLVDNVPAVGVTNDIPALPPTATPRPAPTATRIVQASFFSAAPTGVYRVGAICRDGSSSGATGRGACSWHGGVSCWRMSDGGCR